MGTVNLALLGTLIAVVGLALFPQIVQGVVLFTKIVAAVGLGALCAVVFLLIFTVNVTAGLVGLFRRPKPVPLTPIEAQRMFLKEKLRNILERNQ